MARISFEIELKTSSGELELELPPETNNIEYAVALIKIEDELIKQLVKIKIRRSDRLIDIL